MSDFMVDVDFSGAPAAETPGPSILVTTIDDVVDPGDGLTSLREAIALANDPFFQGGDADGDGTPTDRITFADSLDGATLHLAGSALRLTTAIVIDGGAFADGTPRITISGNDERRIFELSGPDADVLLTGLTLSDGRSSGDGGAIFVAAAAQLRVERSVFEANHAASGGAIDNTGTLSVFETVFRDNSAEARGGAIANRGDLTIEGTTFVGNAAQAGGGVATAGLGSAARVVNSTFVDNRALQNGGGLFVEGGDLAVNASTLTGNTASFSGGGLAHFRAAGFGASSDVSVVNSILLANEALAFPEFVTNGGLAISHSLAAVPGTFGAPAEFVADPALVFASIDPDTGAGILADNSGFVPTVALRTAIDNPALDAADASTASGADARGLLAFDQAGIGPADPDAGVRDLGAFELATPVMPPESPSLVVTIEADTVDAFDGETSLREALSYAANLGGPQTVTFSTEPGAVFETGGTLSLTEGALSITGQVEVIGDLDGDGLADIRIDANADGDFNADISNGPADAGQRHFVLEPGADLTLRGLILTGGAATEGGSILSMGGALTIVDSILHDNIAFDGSGGAIRSVDGAVQLTNTALRDNTALSHGGALDAVDSTVVLENSHIANNFAEFANGGGVRIVGAGDLVAVGVAFEANMAGRDGGGVFSQGAEAVLINAAFVGNGAGRDGGGIRADQGSLSVANTTLAHNSVGRDGGGVSAIGGEVSLTTSTLTGNSAGASGGGLFWLTGDGETAASVSNTIISGNTADDNDDADLGGDLPTVTASLIGGSPAAIFAALDPVTGGGALAAGPGMLAHVPIAIGGPAQNGGDPAALPADQADIDGDGDITEALPLDARGASRQSGSGLDIGAVEIQNAVPTAMNDTASTPEDTPVEIDVLGNDSDPENAPLALKIVTGPANGSVSIGDNNLLTYTPDADFSGSDQLTYEIDDGAGETAQAIVTITVAGSGDAPVAGPDEYTLDEDTVLTAEAGDSVLANDTDGDGDSLTATLLRGPDHGALEFNPDGTFEYTPDPDYHGEDSFVYQASDGLFLSAPTEVSITVNAVNDAPLAGDDQFEIGEGESIVDGLLLGNDSDVEGDAFRLTTVNGAAFSPGAISLTSQEGRAVTVTLSGSDEIPLLSFDAAGLFDSLAEGETDNISFTYGLEDDAGAVDEAVVTVLINGENDAPTDENERISVSEDGPAISVDLLANASDPDAGAELAVLDLAMSPAGVLSLDPQSGTALFDPAGAFDSLGEAQAVELALSYTVSDGSLSAAPSVLTITITGRNDDPEAIEDTAQTDEFSAVLIPVLANDSDPDTGFNPISGTPTEDRDRVFVTEVEGVEILPEGFVELPSGARVRLMPDGQLRYDPNGAFSALGPGDLGEDVFSYTIGDGNGGTALATVRVQIEGLVDPIEGDDGPNVLNGTSGLDAIFGFGGDDRIDGLAGDDLIDGGFGADQIFGRSGEDTIRGGAGADIVNGGGAADLITAGPGNDTVQADAGNDVILLGDGDDLILPGVGADLLVAVSGQTGDDTIFSFRPGEGDRLDLSALGVFSEADLAAITTDSAGSAVVTLGADASLTFVGLNLAALAATLVVDPPAVATAEEASSRSVESALSALDLI